MNTCVQIGHFAASSLVTRTVNDGLREAEGVLCCFFEINNNNNTNNDDDDDDDDDNNNNDKLGITIRKGEGMTQGTFGHWIWLASLV